MKYCQPILQIGLIIVLSEAGNILSTQLHLPLPGNIIGMLLLFLLLVSGLLPLRVIEKGANLILKYMALFFIPAGVGLIGYWSNIQNHLLGFITVVVLSTLIVLIITGKTTDFTIGLQQRLKKKGRIT